MLQRTNNTNNQTQTLGTYPRNWTQILARLNRQEAAPRHAHLVPPAERQQQVNFGLADSADFYRIPQCAGPGPAVLASP